jgi:1-acyl-sn-glycerol-3-phosphate acyltransferase
MWFYHLAAFLVRSSVRMFYGLRVEGLEHVPLAGALVVSGNHTSSFDPPVIGVALPREINYMAKRELFEEGWSRLLMRNLRAFPVNRSGNDTGAVKEALRRLRAGAAVGVFPQGTRNAGEAEALDGAAFLAQRAPAPLLPVAIWREGRAFHVRFGPTLQPAGKSREEIVLLTQRLMRSIAALMPPEEYRVPSNEC